MCEWEDAVNDRDNPQRDSVRGMIRASGLVLSDTEMDQVIALYERLADDRATLTRQTFGDDEPAPIFQAPRWSGQP